jgi:hypothetical protein
MLTSVAEDQLRMDLKLVMGFPEPPDELRDLELRSFVPKDPTLFAIHVQALIGTADSDPGDLFDVLVCSPTWLAQHFDQTLLVDRLSEGTVLLGRHYWLMERWDYRAVERAIDQLVGGATGPSWSGLANWLDRYMPWEYSYVHDREHDVNATIIWDDD